MLILRVKINTLRTQFQFDNILSFKLDVLKTQAPTTEKNAGYEFLSASIILHMYLKPYTLYLILEKWFPLQGERAHSLNLKKSNFNPN